MPQTKFQDIVFTIIMATAMVYGMICYNIALSMGTFSPAIFVLALHELPIMVAIAFVLEFFIVGKVAGFFAFKLVKPSDSPFIITCTISLCICMIMCPIMSAIATVLFNADPGLAAFGYTYLCNLPMAIAYQLCLCGPVVRMLFRVLFFKQLKYSAPA